MDGRSGAKSAFAAGLKNGSHVKAGQIGEAEDAKGKARILSLGGKIVRE